MLVYNRGPFVPRLPILRKLEGKYDDITLSCRHRDILRCSVTRHFSSCFKPSHLHELQPKLYCYVPEVCIVYKIDRSGQFLARCFGFWNNGTLTLAKIYGNGMTYDDVRKKLKKDVKFSGIKISETFGDVYFQGSYSE